MASLEIFTWWNCSPKGLWETEVPDCGRRLQVRSPPQATAVCRHCLQILTAEMSKIPNCGINRHPEFLTSLFHGGGDKRHFARGDLASIPSRHCIQVYTPISVTELAFSYSILFCRYDVQMSNFFTLWNDAVLTRGNAHKVLLNANCMNVRRHFFTERIAPVWNSLPPAVVDFRSLPLFKKTIYAARVNLFTRYWCLCGPVTSIVS